MKDKPADSKWTDEQWEAIADEHRPMLVAAAAGSGKTAVLVERIVRKIIDPGNNIALDQLLVVTFTNAAAAEMKQRIGKAIENELLKEPGSNHLRRQLSLLQRASISTLHSFCMNVIRTYYYELGIDPQFRMLDQTESQLLEEEVAEEMIETAYREDPEFIKLVDYFTGDRTDDQLKVLFLELYHFSRSHPDPENWLNQIIKVYESSGTEEFDNLPWVQEAAAHVKEKLSYCISRLELAVKKSKSPEGPGMYVQTLQNNIHQLNFLLNAAGWEDLNNSFKSLKLESLPRVVKKNHPDMDPQLQKEVQAIRKKVSEDLEAVENSFFHADSDLIAADMQQMAPVLKQLIFYVNRFSQLFQQEKVSRNSLDFSDLEHYCLALLQQEETPTDIAIQYQQEFQEVLVDEYQDTNFVQETILTKLSGTDQLFMVGDVKQSIYRFRLAEPGLFLNKYKQYQQLSEGKRVDLTKNFRSREEVLSSTNFVFRQIMSENFGELEYDEAAALKQGNFEFSENDTMSTEVLIVDKQKKENNTSELEELETSQIEARAIAEKIREMVDSKFMIYDKFLKTERPVTYKDFVLLMRSMPWAETMMEEFQLYDIPLYADLSTGYFEAIEIKVMLALLHTVDNPYQDIPLASVLRSPIFSLDEEMLSTIRLRAPEDYYFTALKMEAEAVPEGKAAAALQQLEKWRDAARSNGLSELIWKLYEESGYLEYVGGLPGGKQRRANLTALYDRARAYETTSFRGLFRFLRFIERMQERGDDLGKARAIGEQEDVVRLMTIHKSKGLEFPVVFVAGMNKQFNMMDVNKSYLKHKRLGFAARFIDPVHRISYPTIYYYVVRERIRKEMLAEEMRILYVAMTRAEQKLILTGTVDQLEDSLAGWTAYMPGEKVPESQLSQAKNFLDWIMPAALNSKEGNRFLQNFSTEKYKYLESNARWKFTVLQAGELEAPLTEDVSTDKDFRLRAVENLEPVETKSEKQSLSLDWQYPFNDAVRTRVKQSVTELKEYEKDPYAAENLVQIPSAFDRPKFVQEKAFNPAELGTILHKLMQFINFNITSAEEVEKEIYKLVIEEKMMKTEAEQINIHWITAFLNSQIGDVLRRSVRIKRELPFTYPIEASTIYSEWNSKEEYLFVQGIMDCVYETENGELYILDYKTDRITGRFHSDQEITAYFKEKYSFQLSLYKQALESAWNRKVSGACLYMFDGGYVIETD
ncbi:helicase-exonuclease AddAB subunit AddA [Alkalicoccus daliensis]|uniref:ATP-dependent helicase/nuclease subunit A n=1 Tax=Alkalicoccus daliensis TaxID=745820 RepID=A0A1H0ALC0_9BACI|nr:helicase-exonuclease AddAB subunit AddA [Alkalicoccus daliensis]SDN34348.1 DNA helicase/exodeoxyribonuclease V, subunit A [Alkalicoccus daliensis]